MIPGDLDLSVNFKITQRFLLRWSVFPDYLFVSCDFDAMQIIRLMHVCISLFHHQIKTYKQNSQKKMNYNIDIEYNPNRHLPI